MAYRGKCVKMLLLQLLPPCVLTPVCMLPPALFTVSVTACTRRLKRPVRIKYQAVYAVSLDMQTHQMFTPGHIRRNII